MLGDKAPGHRHSEGEVADLLASPARVRVCFLRIGEAIGTNTIIFDMTICLLHRRENAGSTQRLRLRPDLPKMLK